MRWRPLIRIYGASMNEKKIYGIFRGASFHWVGDGFRVSNYFPGGNKLGERISPFILMDYAPPYEYAPTKSEQRGVGPHPHRGFETVTIAFAGSVAHHDSAGNSGEIGPGDVQWMTAASGVLHKEYHEKKFAEKGGPMHMAQIWVNLPKAHKMDKPHYQALAADNMGKVVLPNNAGKVRIIAGEFQGVKGPAKTYTQINMFDIYLQPNGKIELSFPAKENTGLLVIKGKIKINDKSSAEELDFVLFENEGEQIKIEAETEAQILLLNGTPINEPVVQYGPFVMNTEDEIRQAMRDFNSGKFGYLED
jgi:redox-sensitive bicupin YhaK (pirin superfamily)